MEITKLDKELMEQVKAKLGQNCDLPDLPHYVVSGILAESGKMYFGMNVDSWVGTCAELVALSNARLGGERKFVSSVTMRRVGDTAEIVSPCGRCREIFKQYCPEIQTILNDDNQNLTKVDLKTLLPFSYKE